MAILINKGTIDVEYYMNLTIIDEKKGQFYF